VSHSITLHIVSGLNSNVLIAAW